MLHSSCCTGLDTSFRFVVLQTLRVLPPHLETCMQLVSFHSFKSKTRFVFDFKSKDFAVRSLECVLKMPENLSFPIIKDLLFAIRKHLYLASWISYRSSFLPTSETPWRSIFQSIFLNHKNTKMKILLNIDQLHLKQKEPKIGSFC